MECSDCHTVEKGGMLMKAVTMEQHCSSCHELTFDPAAPDRVVPHGDPEDLINLLRGYYAYQYFQENAEPGSSRTLRTAPEPTRKARRPGARRQTIAGFQQSIPNQAGTKEAQEFVDKRVSDASSTLFEKRTCVICHELDGVDGDGVWQVVPVKLTSDWMPLAEFSHDSHQNMTCDGCHEAASSDKASDVSMPDIESCRTCHGGEHAQNKLQSKCVACHDFHLDHQAPMSVVLSVDSSGKLIDQLGNFVDRQGNILSPADPYLNSAERQAKSQAAGESADKP